MASPVKLHSLIALLLFICACGKRESHERIPQTGHLTEKASIEHNSAPQLVILYIPCTVSRSFLSPYRDGIEFTPNLQKFSEDGVVFENHRTEAGLSGIAYASILTGRQAEDHGVFTHPRSLSSSIYDISRAFSESGYEVLYWGDHAQATQDLGYMPAASSIYETTLRGRDKDFRTLLKKIADDESYRAFIVASFTVTHAPYKSDKYESFCEEFHSECGILDELSDDSLASIMDVYSEHRFQLQFDLPGVASRLDWSDLEVENLARVLRVLYKSNMHYLDQLFGSVIEQVDDAGLKGDSLIAFTTDHGETMRSEDFNWSHGHSLNNSVLSVPWIVRGPGISAQRYEGVTRSIDVFPTLAGLAGISLPEGADVSGVNLAPAIRGEVPAPKLLAFSHSAKLPDAVANQTESDLGYVRAQYYPRSDIRLTWACVFDGDFVVKYRGLGDKHFGYRAYAPEDDPRETHNVFDIRNKRISALADKVRAYRRKLIAAHDTRESGETVEVTASRPDSADELQRLKTLGYL